MQPSKVNVLIAQFAYGGNGGIPMTIPSHVPWVSHVCEHLNKDERVGKVAIQQFSDTPIPMMRNLAVKIAKTNDYDIILMLDSDNQPDCELKDDPAAKPFFQTSFDFLYERLVQGLPTLVAAPYCGPPPEENVYCFFWEGHENSPHTYQSLEPYPRNIAARFTGIQPIAAGPTGVTLYATKIFECMEPPYFYYEYKDAEQTEKASTEDVTNFRDLALTGWNRHQQDLVFCNWDAWAAHAKVKYVRKPRLVCVEDIGARFRDAILRDERRCDRVIHVEDFTNDTGMTINPAPEIPTETCDSNDESGVNIRKRMIFGHVVTSVGHQTKEEDLEALGMLVEMAGQAHPRTALRMLDVGSWVGESAVTMALHARNPGSVVFCVDDFSGGHIQSPLTRVVDYLGGPEEVEKYFRANCGELLNDQIKLLRGDSSQVAQGLDPQEANLIFLDVCHSYEQTKQAIADYLPHMSEDGILCGHDYNEDEYPGVVEAVNECFDGVTVRHLGGTDIWCVTMREYHEWRKTSQKSSTVSA